MLVIQSQNQVSKALCKHVVSALNSLSKWIKKQITETNLGREKSNRTCELTI